MTHHQFSEIVARLDDLSPEQMRQLRRELDGKLVPTGQEPGLMVASRDAVGLPDPCAEDVPEARATAAREVKSDAPRKPIWERVLERTAAIPEEEWDKLPTDLAEQHDHYLYGTPKRPTA